MKECWKDIEKYAGKYQISNYGRVRNSKGLIMSQRVRRDGYVCISLIKDGKYISEYVHRLVALAFVSYPSLDGEYEVNHIDGVKINNNADNLEWISARDNTKHAILHSLRSINPAAGKYGKDSNTSKPVAQYDKQGNLIKIWPSREEAARYYKTQRGNICNCVNGRKKTLFGYVWKNA